MLFRSFEKKLFKSGNKIFLITRSGNKFFLIFGLEIKFFKIFGLEINLIRSGNKIKNV